jgi:hypothetical protein
VSPRHTEFVVAKYKRFFDKQGTPHAVVLANVKSVQGML